MATRTDPDARWAVLVAEHWERQRELQLAEGPDLSPTRHWVYGYAALVLTATGVGCLLRAVTILEWGSMSRLGSDGGEALASSARPGLGGAILAMAGVGFLLAYSRDLPARRRAPLRVLASAVVAFVVVCWVIADWVWDHHYTQLG